MSTKVYNAFRCPISKLPAVLARIEKKMLRLLKEDVVYAMSLEDGQENAYERIQSVLTKAEKNSTSARRVDRDFSCGVRIYLKGVHAYMIPWGEHWRSVSVPHEAQDYCYQNSTDEIPGNCTEREWKARGRKWKQLLDGPMLEYSVIDMRGPYNGQSRMKLIELVQEYWKP